VWWPPAEGASYTEPEGVPVRVSGKAPEQGLSNASEGSFQGDAPELTADVEEVIEIVTSGAKQAMEEEAMRDSDDESDEETIDLGDLD